MSTIRIDSCRVLGAFVSATVQVAALLNGIAIPALNGIVRVFRVSECRPTTSRDVRVAVDRDCQSHAVPTDITAASHQSFRDTIVGMWCTSQGVTQDTIDSKAVCWYFRVWSIP